MAAVCVAAAAISTDAVAQICPPGHYYQTGICYPYATPGGVVEGAANTARAVAGSAVGAAGTIAGGAVNAAGQIVGGTVGVLTGQPCLPRARGTDMPSGICPVFERLLPGPVGFSLVIGWCRPAERVLKG
jgi:hypothetical protein